MPTRRHRPLPHLLVSLGFVLAFLCGISQAQEKKPAKPDVVAKANGEEAPEKAKKDPGDKPLIPKNAAVDATVWGAVIHATEADLKDTDAKPPRELADLNQRLAKIKQFKDYKNFKVIGQHTQKIFSEYTNWVVPSKELFLNIDSKGPADDGGINLHVQLWRGTKVLVKTDTILKKGSPLIIGGPEWRKGQLIFVLLLK